MERFWLLWLGGQEVLLQQHPTQEIANQELRRLLLTGQAESGYILETVAKGSLRKDIQWEE